MEYMDREYLIKKWLSNDLTPTEKKAFEFLDDYDEHIEIIDGLQYFKASNFSKAANFEELENRMESRTPVRKINWIKPLMRIAGLFIIGLGVYYFFFFNNLTVVNTMASQKTTIELPDSSRVILNAITEIGYNKENWAQNREVSLDGEAFFKVAKGKVFDVVTDKGIVTVIGTQFNVKHRLDYFEVICYEGVVRVQTKNIAKKLFKGDIIQLYDGELLSSRTLSEQPQWIENMSVFQSVPYIEVIYELERQYNVELDIKSINIEYNFTGSFVHDHLEDALKSITEPLELNYTIESLNQVIIYNAKG